MKCKPENPEFAKQVLTILKHKNGASNGTRFKINEVGSVGNEMVKMGLDWDFGLGVEVSET